MTKLSAKWIWDANCGSSPYNQSIIALREFDVKSVKDASISITADSNYRLYINDRWVCDGPSRAWPEHYQYDVVDITGYLQKGVNNIMVAARYFGTGTFHQVPAAAGLIAQIEITTAAGKKQTIITDDLWLTTSAKCWASDTPKISIQMEPAEYYDARFESKLKFSEAAVLFDAGAGPWKDLKPRDVAMLNRVPVGFTKFLGENTIADEPQIWCAAFRKLLYPKIIEANRNWHTPFVLGTIIDAKKTCTINIKAVTSTGLEEAVALDGKMNKSGVYKLSAGRHTVLAIGGANKISHGSELSIIYNGSKDAVLCNPIKDGHENPWVFAKFREYDFLRDDLNFEHLIETDADCAAKYEGFQKYKTELYKKSKTAESFCELMSGIAVCMSPNKMFVKDGHVRFMYSTRKPAATVINPEALMYDNPQTTTVMPTKDAAVELVYDLGEQRCGYYDFELVSSAGVEIDIYGVEYITTSGKIQHTRTNRNGMTYITKDGLNCFTSLKRRSGRYIFVSLRNVTAPVAIRKIGVIESTYPVQYRGSFSCSDQAFNRIWEISARTLKLCMEDTLTDCPLYEQTLWVGDARNESLFAYQIFGAFDIARRCAEINAQSLERYPIAGAQVPSSWDCLIPAWSFLWGISVWEHYWYTGDAKWLAGMWKYVLKNIEGALAMVNESGLMNCDYWNFFDWSGIDSAKNVVMHNSMLLVGAMDAAIKCGKVLGDAKQVDTLTEQRKTLTAAINGYWDKKKNAYPDSLLADGSPSESICQHTSFLAVLYDIIEAKNNAAAMKNILNPSEGMVKVGSPFAIMYMYEALEKTGHHAAIIDSIRQNYLPMLEAGATTVWESFATGSLAADEFPTRSHCHAWSSAPIYFFVRILLGVKQTGEGGKAFEISPYICGLQYADGTVATALGEVKVSWKLEGKRLRVNYSGPQGVKLSFAKNSSMDALEVIVNK